MKIEKLQPTAIQVSKSSDLVVTAFFNKSTGTVCYKDEDGTIVEIGSDTAATVLNSTFRNNMQTSNMGAPLTSTVTLTASEIVGTSAGTLGHVDGVELVPTPGIGYALQFISGVLIYDMDNAPYQGGGDDTTFNISQVAQSGVVSKADLIGAVTNKIVAVNPLEAGVALVENVGIALTSGTAWTPHAGGSFGVVRAITTYRIVTTGL